MESPLSLTGPDAPHDWYLDRALLDWQLELGVDECIGDAPVNRFEVAAEAQAEAAQGRTGRSAPPVVQVREEVDAVDVARQAAQAAGDLAALRSAMERYEHCDLRRGARSFVFSDGNPAARVMILGEAPGREEDREGRPFVGPAGRLLDRMLAAIGLDRAAEDAARAVYIANVLPWRPPGNRDPEPAEIAMMLPFLQRHIALADPEVIVLMGNSACQAALGQRGIVRLRGTWAEAFGKPALPMYHPAYLLRTAVAKRDAWADLLSLSERLAP